MFGYSYFKKLFNDLDYQKKIVLLNHIFHVDSILSFSITLRDNKIIFRLYNGNFYQFVFNFLYQSDYYIYSMFEGRYCLYYIYPMSSSFNENSSYYLLVQLLLSDDINYIEKMFQLLLS